jgi:hypothetical protein
MQYTLIHVCVGEHILERAVFFDKREAKARARELSREKVWNIGGSVYFGNVYIKMFNFDTHAASNA